MERQLTLANVTFCVLTILEVANPFPHITQENFLAKWNFAFFKIRFMIKSFDALITFYYNFISGMTFHVLLKVIMPCKFFMANVACSFFLVMFFHVMRKVEAS